MSFLDVKLDYWHNMVQPHNLHKFHEGHFIDALKKACDEIDKLKQLAEAAKSLEHVMDNSEDVQFSLCEMRVYDAFKYALAKLEK